MSFLDSFKPQESVPTLDVPAAGAKAVVGEGKTADCLKFEDPCRPRTRWKKYRKSFYGEPGARVQHPGLIDDAIAMREQLGTTTFGATSGEQHVRQRRYGARPSDENGRLLE